MSKANSIASDFDTVSIGSNDSSVTKNKTQKQSNATNSNSNPGDKRVLTSQLSIQPNIPSHMMLRRSNSGRRIVSQKPSVNFPTKTLRMKSLLWMKPTGVAMSSCSSTMAQVGKKYAKCRKTRTVIQPTMGNELRFLLC